MFAKLRSHHKRSGSNPSSPDVPNPLRLPMPHSTDDVTALPALPVPAPDFFSYKHFGSEAQAQAQAQLRDQYGYGIGHTPGDARIAKLDGGEGSSHSTVLAPPGKGSSAAQKRRQTSPERSRPNGIYDGADASSDDRLFSWRRKSADTKEAEKRTQQRLGVDQDVKPTGGSPTLDDAERSAVGRRPHTSQGPTGLRARGQSTFGLLTGSGGARANSSTTSPVPENAPLDPFSANVERASTVDSTPVNPSRASNVFQPPQSWLHMGSRPGSSQQGSAASPQPVSSPLIKPNPDFLSVAYDDARSRTPPTPFDGPIRRPTSPLPVPPAPKNRPRLNLRNPMALLLRRRENHNVDQLHAADEATLLGLTKSHLPDDYDPRIIGKGVHDFSAPRPPPKRVYTTPNANLLGADNTNLRPSSAEGKRGRGRSISPFKHRRAKTPTFTEHFDENSNTDKSVRAEELADQKFLARNSLRPSEIDKGMPLPPWVKRVSGYPSDVALSPIAQESPTDLQNNASVVNVSKTPPLPEPSPNTEVDNPMGSITATPEVMKGKSTSSQKSTATDASRKSRKRKSRFGHAHLTSNASRFSFQYAGPDSHLQEKLLEERHKVKQQEAAMAAKLRQEEEEFDDDEDAYGEDDDGMYEEAIPGVNADYDDDGLDDGFTMPEGMGGGLADSTLASSTLDPIRVKDDNPLGAQSVIEAQRMALRSNPPSPADCSPASLDSRSIRASSAASGRPSFDRQASSSLSISRRAAAGGEMQSTPEEEEEERGLESIHRDVVKGTSPLAAAPIEARASTFEDDMYFDDGLIEDPGDEAYETQFDESQFDDPNHPLYERKPVMAPSDQTNTEPSPHPALVKSQRVSVEHATVLPQRQRVTSLESDARPFSGTSQQFGDPSRKSHLSDFESIDAYHGALALAANKAFADGRFGRQDNAVLPQDCVPNNISDSEQLARGSGDSSMMSDADRSSKTSGVVSSGQSHSQEENRTSDFTEYSTAPTHLQDGSVQLKSDSPGGFNALRIQSLGSDFNWNPSDYAFNEDDDFDGLDDDDQIIAAANAEALANDDEGEYGREFGFYSAPPMAAGSQSGSRARYSGDGASDSSDAGSDSEYANGGYFGPKGVDVIGRSKSTREPNLTPITERSEYSTRNSFISVGDFGFAGPRSAISPLSAGSGPVSSPPGLAQLAALSSPLAWDDDELERLKRLRHAAWGEGSRKNSIGGEDGGSIAGNRSRDSSPIAAQSGGYLLPKAPILVPISAKNPGNANAPVVGWQNGVGIGIGNAEGLNGLGEDDESSSEDDEDVEGEQDSDYDANEVVDDRVYDNDEYSPTADSPTITAADTSNLHASPPQDPITGDSIMDPFFLARVLETPPRSKYAIPTYIPSGPVSVHNDPHTPTSPGSPASPTTAFKTTSVVKLNIPHLSSSPSPMPKPGSHKSATMPHSPAHSRNSSANEGVTVTYVKEKDDSVDGGVRWVMERRRVEANGDVTIVDRQVVTGGRI